MHDGVACRMAVEYTVHKVGQVSTIGYGETASGSDGLGSVRASSSVRSGKWDLSSDVLYTFVQSQFSFVMLPPQPRGRGYCCRPSSLATWRFSCVHNVLIVPSSAIKASPRRRHERRGSRNLQEETSSVEAPLIEMADWDHRLRRSLQCE